MPGGPSIQQPINTDDQAEANQHHSLPTYVHRPRRGQQMNNLIRLDSKATDSPSQNHPLSTPTTDHIPGGSNIHQPISTGEQAETNQHHGLPTHGHFSQQIKRRFTSEEAVDNFLAGISRDIKQVIVNAHQRHPESNKRTRNPEVHHSADNPSNNHATTSKPQQQQR